MILYLHLGMPKALGMCPWRCGGSEEGGEDREAPGCYKASYCCAWTVDCTTSISEVHAVSV